MVRQSSQNELKRTAKARLSAACGLAVELLEARQMLAAHIVGSATVYSTIQAAVDAANAGATINVDAGNYAELVTVYKSVTINGAQAGVDARTNTRAALVASGKESIITGSTGSSGVSSSFYITANDVTIDGFTVQGATAQFNDGGGIVMAPSIHGTHIVNDIIQNNFTGLVLSNNSTTDPVLIQHDFFLNNTGPGNNSSRGIYSDGGVSGGLLTNVVIDSNAFVVNKVATGGSPYEGCVALEGTASGDQQNITITNNIIDGTGKLLLYNCNNVDIEHNVMTHTMDQWSGTFRFEGGDTNVTIKYNTVYDNTGLGVSIDTKGYPASDSGFVIEDNNFYNNNTAYGNKYSLAATAGAIADTIDAKNNYWGAANGPSGQFSGSGDMAWGNGVYAAGAGSGWSTGAGTELTATPYSATAIGTLDSPYWGVPENTGAPIQAEDFNQGGNGNGYSTTATSNAGGAYRTAEKVGIATTTDTGGGYYVGWTLANEWLDYTFNAAQGGTYSLQVRVASDQATGGKYHLNIDGVNVTGSLTVPNTGNKQTFTTVTISGINITAGTHVLRLAMDSLGNGGYVGNFNWLEVVPVNVASPPAAPSNVTATATSATNVNLAWQESSTNQTGFVIQRSTDGVTFAQVGTATATARSYADSTAVAGTSYTYRIYATSAIGNSANSANVTATTPGIASAPTGLKAVATAATNVNLTWTDTAAALETGFIIQRAVGTSTTFTQVGTTAKGVTSFSDTTTAGGTSYTYRVIAISAGGNSAASATASATTPAAGSFSTPLSSLTWVSATAGWNSVQKNLSIAGNPLTLNGVTYTTGLGTHAVSNIVYNLAGAYTNFISDIGIDGEEKNNGGSVDFKVLGDNNAVLYDSGVLTNLSATVSINVNVTGVKTLTLVATNGVAGSIDFDHADWAGAQLLSATALPPAAPSGLTAVAASSTQVNLAWANNAPTATSFIIQRATGTSTTFTQIGATAGNVTTYSDTTAAAATSYTYRVLAVSAGGNSSPSATASATTPAAGSITTYLSDMNWVSATAGWNTVQKNLSISGNPITLNGVTYAKGIGTHAVSNIVYNLAGGYTNFISDIGIDGEEKSNGGSVDFKVLGDNGAVLFDSGVLTNTSATVSINVNVTGVKTLTLVATNGIAGSIDFDHADWAGARLLSSSAQPPVAPSNLVAVASSATQVNLTWTNNAPAATGFIIQRAVSGSSTYKQVGTTAAGVTTFFDTTAAAGTAYTYEVLATNGTLNSAASNIAGATTLAASAVVTNLSSLPWVSATSGYNTVQLDTSVVGNPITLRGVVYGTGIGTHAVSNIVYNLAGTYSNFLSDVGIDDEELTKGVGSVDFQVIGDGKVLFDSGVLTNSSQIVSINVNVTGVQQLTLVATNGVANSIDYDHADWAGARLVAAGSGGAVVTGAVVEGVRPASTISALNIVDMAAPGVPTPWANISVGNTGQLGSASDTAGVFTVAGAGAGIAGTADALDYVYQSITGNGTIIAHLNTAQNGVDQAGILIREGAGANAKEVGLILTQKGVKLMSRSKTGGKVAAPKVAAARPEWEKLVRKGNTFTAFISVDGKHWKRVGATTIKMSESVDMGLAAASGTSAALNSSLFSDVSVTA